MLYILIYSVLFLGIMSALSLLAGAIGVLRLSVWNSLMFLPALLLGIVSADAFLLGGVAVGKFLPSPMALYFLFGGLLLIPITLICLALNSAAIWIGLKHRKPGAA